MTRYTVYTALLAAVLFSSCSRKPEPLDLYNTFFAAPLPSGAKEWECSTRFDRENDHVIAILFRDAVQCGEFRRHCGIEPELRGDEEFVEIEGLVKSAKLRKTLAAEDFPIKSGAYIGYSGKTKTGKGVEVFALDRRMLMLIPAI